MGWLGAGKLMLNPNKAETLWTGNSLDIELGRLHHLKIVVLLLKEQVYNLGGTPRAITSTGSTTGLHRSKNLFLV